MQTFIRLMFVWKSDHEKWVQKLMIDGSAVPACSRIGRQVNRTEKEAEEQGEDAVSLDGQRLGINISGLGLRDGREGPVHTLQIIAVIRRIGGSTAGNQWPLTQNESPPVIIFLLHKA